jgi:hypothetical protein
VIEGGSVARASFAQDVWVGREPRLRARRLGPYDEPGARVVFHLDLGATLDDPEVGAFLESIAVRVEVVALEPRGQGGSSGRFGPELHPDHRDVLDGAPRRWPDDVPLLVAGHGLGGSLAIAAADLPSVRGVAALSPASSCEPAALEPVRQRVRGHPRAEEVQALLDGLELRRRLAALGVPVLLVERRQVAGALGAPPAVPGSAHLAFEGEPLACLAPPWVDVLADWALWAAAR